VYCKSSNGSNEDYLTRKSGGKCSGKNRDLCLVYGHVYQWLKTGFGFVIRFTDHLQVVATINCNISKITVIITRKQSLTYGLIFRL
jgi:hypothetical protein